MPTHLVNAATATVGLLALALTGCTTPANQPPYSPSPSRAIVQDIGHATRASDCNNHISLREAAEACGLYLIEILPPRQAFFSAYLSSASNAHVRQAALRKLRQTHTPKAAAALAGQADSLQSTIPPTAQLNVALTRFGCEDHCQGPTTYTIHTYEQWSTDNQQVGWGGPITVTFRRINNHWQVTAIQFA